MLNHINYLSSKTLALVAQQLCSIVCLWITLSHLNFKLQRRLYRQQEPSNMTFLLITVVPDPHPPSRPLPPPPREDRPKQAPQPQQRNSHVFKPMVSSVLHPTELLFLSKHEKVFLHIMLQNARDWWKLRKISKCSHPQNTYYTRLLLGLLQWNHDNLVPRWVDKIARSCLSSI